MSSAAPRSLARLRRVRHHARVSLLGESMKIRREELRLGQGALAAKLGVSQQTVSRWEQGLAVPRPSRIPELADCLQLPAERLHQLAGYLPEKEQSDANGPWHEVYERMAELTQQELMLLVDRAWEELRTRAGLHPPGAQ